MNQCVPLFCPFSFIQERMEYLEKGIVGDCFDGGADMFYKEKQMSSPFGCCTEGLYDLFLRIHQIWDSSGMLRTTMDGKEMG